MSSRLRGNRAGRGCRTPVLGALSVALLGLGCGHSAAHVAPPATSVSPSATSVAPPATSVAPSTNHVGPAAPTLLVGNSVHGASSLTEFPDGVTGNVAPSNTITGPGTHLGAVNGLAVDAAGDIFFASFKFAGADAGVFEFAPGATGNASPVSILQGVATAVKTPQGIAIDASGTHLWVVNGNNSVTEYALPLAAGLNTTAPIATISGANTGLNNSSGMSIDGSGNIFVANSASVTEFASTANGNVAPIAVLAGANTGLSSPNGVALENGRLFVANNSSAITEYTLPLPNGSTLANPGNVAPVATLSGPATALNAPVGMVFDSSANLFVANNGNSSITAYAASQYATSGSPTPYITIAGTNTGLQRSGFIALLKPAG